MLKGMQDMYLPQFGPLVQLGFVVKDFDAALEFWTQKMKVGPFVTFEESLGDRVFYHRDVLSDVQMKVAIGFRGDTQIEIIHQLNDAPSNYNEFLNAGKEGLQHLGFFPEDFNAAVEAVAALGFPEASSIRTAHGEKNAIYYDSAAHFGVQLELAPMTEARKTYFKGIKALAQNWDGSAPVRRYKTRAEFMNSSECLAAA